MCQQDVASLRTDDLPVPHAGARNTGIPDCSDRGVARRPVGTGQSKSLGKGALADALQSGSREFGITPVLALLWITAPVAVPATMLVFMLGVAALVSTRNLIVHAPTQF